MRNQIPILVCLCLFPGLAWGDANDRLALIIGNTEYGGNLQLRNPGNDADELESALQDLGFTVIKKKDLDLDQMEEAVLEFRQKLPDGGLGLFYYSGHGLQVKGENYLVPIKAKVREEFEVKRECLDVNTILEAMGESDCNLKVMILDCCRNNPLKKSWKKSVNTEGLAAIGKVPEGTVIAFATSPGEEAEDGRGKNSPYAEHLVATLRSRPEMGLELGNIFRETGRRVKRATGQVPWLNMEASIQEYFLKSGNMGSIPKPDQEMTFVRGFGLFHGIGSKIDEPRAVDLLLQAAENENPLAMVLVARFYLQGTQLKANPEEAERWGQKAFPQVSRMAEEGNLMAQHFLGICYEWGIGIARDDAQAINWYRKAADKNYAPSQCSLGWLYRDGRGAPQDYVQSLTWLRKAADQNFAFAQLNLGVMYENGQGVSPDPAEAARWYRKAGEQNEIYASNNLGVMYQNGKGVPKDYVEAVRWYRKAAIQNDLWGQNNLGVMYQNGWGVTQDDAEAVQWYRKSAEQNLAQAQINLGWMYQNSRGVPQDFEEAVRWYQKAADQNEAVAQCNLGTMYLRGEGVTKDPVEAAKWFRKGADQNDAQSQNELGVLYQNGEGVTQDLAEAAKWFRKAADQNYAQAQNNLGVMYQDGKGVDQNLPEAARWYRKAADQNHAWAQNNLGVMYQNGSGVQQNFEEAVRWYRKAAEQNHAWAQLNLGAMYHNGEGVAQNYDEAENWYRKVLKNPDSDNEVKKGAIGNLQVLGKSP